MLTNGLFALALMPIGLIGCTADVEPEEPGAALPDASPNIDAPDQCPAAEALWEDIDLATFEIIPAFEELDLAAVTPAEPATYWELRFASPGGSTDVLGSVGEKCADAADTAACTSEFDQLSTDSGFGTGCLPGYCFHYVVVNRGDTNTVIDTQQKLIDFLGTIDAAAEAALIAHANGYWWDPSKQSTADVRAADGGFDLLVLGLVSDCAPVRHDRFLLHIAADGAVAVQRQQVYSVVCDACI
ncbi:MAG: hypothetical protein Tsb0020_47180 [Haliangiales bacterium]